MSGNNKYGWFGELFPGGGATSTLPPDPDVQERNRRTKEGVLDFLGYTGEPGPQAEARRRREEQEQAAGAETEAAQETARTAERDAENEDLNELNLFGGDPRNDPGFNPEEADQYQREREAAAAARGKAPPPLPKYNYGQATVGGINPYAEELAAQAAANAARAEVGRIGKRAEENRLKAGVYGQFAELIAQGDKRAAEVLDRMFDEQERRMRVLEETLAESRSLSVDPAAFFSSTGDAAGFGAGIATAVGHLASVLGGGPNAALDTISKAIDRNIKAQERDMTHSEIVGNQQLNLLQRFEALIGDRETARAATRAALLQQAEMRINQLTAAGNAAVAPEDKATVIAQLQQAKAEQARAIAKQQEVKLNLYGVNAADALRTQRRMEAEITQRQEMENRAYAERLGIIERQQQEEQRRAAPAESAFSRASSRTKQGRQKAAEAPAPQEVAADETQDYSAEQNRVRVETLNTAIAEKGKDSPEAKRAAKDLSQAAYREMVRALEYQQRKGSWTMEQAERYIESNSVLKAAGVRPISLILKDSSQYRKIGNRVIVQTRTVQTDSGNTSETTFDEKVRDLKEAESLAKEGASLYRDLETAGYGGPMEFLTKVAKDATLQTKENMRIWARLTRYYGRLANSARITNGLGVVRTDAEIKIMQKLSGTPTDIDKWLDLLDDDDTRALLKTTHLAFAQMNVEDAKRLMDQWNLEFLDERVPSGDDILGKR